MKVQDLIYLLQTRAKPEQDILIEVNVTLPDGTIHRVIIDMEDSFDAVYTESLGSEYRDEVCIIMADDCAEHNLRMALKAAEKPE